MFAELLKTGAPEAVKAYLDAEPLAIKGKDPDGVPWLFYLAKRGDAALFRHAVEYSRADLCDKDALGRNALFYAIDGGSDELIRYLLDRVGQDPLEADRLLMTPLEYAAGRPCEAILAEKTGFRAAEGYKNPVRRGFSPDPSITRVGEDYYMVNSSFLAFPGLPISHSRDLVRWRTIGHAVSWHNAPDMGGLEPGRGFWAADISYHEGRFYVIATLRLNDRDRPMRRQMAVWAERPEGPYSEPVFFDEDGIDPSLFRDKGRCFVLLNRGARVFEVDPLVRTRLGGAKLLYYGDTKKSTEAPHLLKHDGYYYLFLAEGGTGFGHRINVARAASLEGPYTPCPYNPILRQTDADMVLQRCGHGKPFMAADGTWYIIYLGSRCHIKGLSALGRETFLDRLDWTADGWPVINQNKGPSALAPLPLPPAPPETPEPEGFAGLDWFFARRPAPGAFSLRDGALRLAAGPLPHERDAVLYLRRQEEPRGLIYQVTADPAGLEAGKAGLAAYYDENSWYLLYVTQDGRPGLARNAGGGPEILAESGESVRGPVTLRYAPVFTRHAFSAEAGGRIIFSFTDSSPILSDEGLSLGKRFTGPAVGVTAAGEGTALFTGFVIRPEET